MYDEYIRIYHVRLIIFFSGKAAWGRRRRRDGGGDAQRWWWRCWRRRVPRLGATSTRRDASSPSAHITLSARRSTSPPARRSSRASPPCSPAARHAVQRWPTGGPVAWRRRRVHVHAAAGDLRHHLDRRRRAADGPLDGALAPTRAGGAHGAHEPGESFGLPPASGPTTVYWVGPLAGGPLAVVAYELLFMDVEDAGGAHQPLPQE